MYVVRKREVWETDYCKVKPIISFHFVRKSTRFCASIYKTPEFFTGRFLLARVKLLKKWYIQVLLEEGRFVIKTFPILQIDISIISSPWVCLRTIKSSKWLEEQKENRFQTERTGGLLGRIFQETFSPS